MFSLSPSLYLFLSSVKSCSECVISVQQNHFHKLCGDASAPRMPCNHAMLINMHRFAHLAPPSSCILMPGAALIRRNVDKSLCMTGTASCFFIAKCLQKLLGSFFIYFICIYIFFLYFCSYWHKRSRPCGGLHLGSAIMFKHWTQHGDPDLNLSVDAH